MDFEWNPVTKNMFCTLLFSSLWLIRMARNSLSLMTDVDCHMPYDNCWSLSIVMYNRFLSYKNIPGILLPEPGGPKFSPVVKWRILFHPLVSLGWRRRMKEIVNSFPHVGIVSIKLFWTKAISVSEKNRRQGVPKAELGNIDWNVIYFVADMV